MADKKISQLDALLIADSVDLLAIVDLGASQTKKITIAGLMTSPGPIGSVTPSTGEFTTLELPTGVTVNELSSNTSLGTSDTALPTQNAVKTYVDNYVAQDNVRRISSDSTADVGDVILVDTTAGDVNIVIDTSVNGRTSIKKVTSDTNDVIITASSGTIDGAGQKTIDTLNQAYTFLIDTGNVYIF
jgi:hypothetical protein